MVNPLVKLETIGYWLKATDWSSVFAHTIQNHAPHINRASIPPMVNADVAWEMFAHYLPYVSTDGQPGRPTFVALSALLRPVFGWHRRFERDGIRYAIMEK